MSHIRLKSIFGALTSLFMPQYCPECQTEMRESFGYMCDDCWGSLSPAGKGLWGKRKELNGKVYVAFHYGGIARGLVHQMKFYGRGDAGEKLGNQAGERLLEGNLDWDIEAIVPVPLHRVRIRERGYDQNVILAKGIAQRLGLPVRTDLIRRVRHTTAQSRLSDKERLRNLEGAFEPVSTNRSDIPNSVLIVDDVIHTGTTIMECIGALEKLGGVNSYAITACG